MNKKILALVVSLVILIIGGLVTYSLFTKSPVERGLTRVDGYDPNGGCLALYTPACAYCPGEVYESECYVDLSKLSVEEKGYIGL